MSVSLPKSTVEGLISLIRAQPTSSYVAAAKELFEAWLREPGLSMDAEVRRLIEQALRDIGSS